MHWWTSDLHLNHRNIIKYCNRPFDSIEEMNETLIMNWNTRVSKGDLVYVLGDFAWGQGKGYGTLGVREIMNRLNGQMALIVGSHDKPAMKLAHFFVKTTPMLTIKEEGEYITMCHYCMRVWPRSHFNSLHLYGHSHDRLEAVGKSLDVGVDGHDYYPWSWDEIKEYMEDRPDNFNLVKERREG